MNRLLQHTSDLCHNGNMGQGPLQTHRAKGIVGSVGYDVAVIKARPHHTKLHFAMRMQP